MKNDVKALNDILFEQLERLMDDEALVDEKAFDKEIKRAREVASVAGNIVNNYKNVLTAMKMASDMHANTDGLKLLGIEYKNE